MRPLSKLILILFILTSLIRCKNKTSENDQQSSTENTSSPSQDAKKSSLEPLEDKLPAQISGFPVNAKKIRIKSVNIQPIKEGNIDGISVSVTSDDLFQFIRMQVCSKSDPQLGCDVEEFTEVTKTFLGLPEGELELTFNLCVEAKNATKADQNCSEHQVTRPFLQTPTNNKTKVLINDINALDKKLVELCEAAEKETILHQNWPHLNKCSPQIERVMENFRTMGGHMCVSFAEIGAIDEIAATLDEEVNGPPSNNFGKAMMIVGGSVIGISIITNIYLAGRYGALKETDASKVLLSSSEGNAKNFENIKKAKAQLETSKSKGFFERRKIKKEISRYRKAISYNNLQKIDAKNPLYNSAQKYRQSRGLIRSGRYLSGLAAVGGLYLLFVGIANTLDNSYSLANESDGDAITQKVESETSSKTTLTCDQSYETSLNKIGKAISELNKEADLADERLLSEIDTLK